MGQPKLSSVAAYMKSEPLTPTPAQVESVMAKHPAVRRCWGVARKDEPGNKRLVAYFIARDGQSVAPNDLRKSLRRQLPEYMVPPHLVFADAFPLPSNAKIAR